MAERVVSTQITDEERSIENVLRPQTLEQYVGQEADIRCWTARIGRNAVDFCSTSPASARSGVMSSMIHMPRPWVAITRSLSRGWTWTSRTATLGKSPPLNACQLAPPSS